ncbi:hypothetical protein T4B_11391 [Trichinella pseudospiralis]|uniref:Uncharacterized protein n=1 Tax=Trichinella pseudospiralis TaxID=6337 RepID=A0A0V1JIW1_TRIPS|nr:hypothetical protein T4B_11391 [Trichinella pseudospiralis]
MQKVFFLFLVNKRTITFGDVLSTEHKDCSTTAVFTVKLPAVMARPSIIQTVWWNFSIFDKIFHVASSLADSFAADVDDLLKLDENGRLKAVCSNVTSNQKKSFSLVHRSADHWRLKLRNPAGMLRI